MARYFIAPLVVLGIACIFVGLAVPSVCLPYSHGYVRIAAKTAREPGRFEDPALHDKAINDSLESANRLSNIIAWTSVIFGIVSGGALMILAHCLSRSSDLSRQLADARSKLETEIAAKYSGITEGEQARAPNP